MNVKDAIETRRSFRSIESYKVTDELINDLAECAGLAPSCYNNQPWRFVFVKNPEILKNVFSCMTKGNSWTFSSPLVIAVCSRKEFDCMMPDGRNYYQFDSGMACAMLMLRATELEIVAHAIAGFDPVKIKDVLSIPKEIEVITLIITGRKTTVVKPELNNEQAEIEKTRPARKPVNNIVFIDKYK